MQLTPLKAIRKKCVDCAGQEPSQVKECEHKKCELYPLRMGKGTRATLRIIRAYCISCSVGQKHEVRHCPAKGCSLWAYRFGRRPKKKAPDLPEIDSTEGLLGTVVAKEVQRVRLA